MTLGNDLRKSVISLTVTTWYEFLFDPTLEGGRVKLTLTDI